MLIERINRPIDGSDEGWKGANCRPALLHGRCASLGGVGIPKHASAGFPTHDMPCGASQLDPSSRSMERVLIGVSPILLLGATHH